MILMYAGGEGRAAVGLTGSLDQLFVELVGHDGFREIPAITRKKTVLAGQHDLLDTNLGAWPPAPPLPSGTSAQPVLFKQISPWDGGFYNRHISQKKNNQIHPSSQSLSHFFALSHSQMLTSGSSSTSHPGQPQAPLLRRAGMTCSTT